MSSQRYPPEFKDEAVRQVLERGYTVAGVSQRLGGLIRYTPQPQTEAISKASVLMPPRWVVPSAGIKL